MTPQTTTAGRSRSTRAPAIAVAAVLAAAVASLVLSFTVGTTHHKATTAGPTASERHYANAIAALGDTRIAAAYGTGQPLHAVSTANALGSLRPEERRYVHGFSALTPAQLHAAYGAARP
jgi:hypothetical protein